MNKVVIKTEPMDVEMRGEGEGEGDGDGDDDELVREIDVYISPALSDQLYLIQYPLYHNAPLPQAARIKKKHTMIELDHEVPNNIGSEGSFFLSTHTQNSHVISITTHMAMGKILNDGALHLLPLNHITQMRPGFSHVDEQDQQNQASTDEDRKDHGQESSGLEKKPVLFQKKESERAALARKSSYSYKKASEDGEEWLELSICPPQSAEHNSCELKIMSQKKGHQIASGDCKNFVKSLDYLPSRNDVFDEEPQEGLSPLINTVKRLTAMLHRGVPVTYSAIRPQFPDTTVDDIDLLTSMGSCAVLVRGNWYLQSRLLLWDKPVALARNFILYLLHIVGHVQRRGLQVVFEQQIGSEWIETILNQVACVRPGTQGYWSPRLADDIEFCLTFPETLQLHTQYWERQGKRFESKLKIYQANIQR